MQAILQAALPNVGNAAVAVLAEEKEEAEQGIEVLLAEARKSIAHKLQLTKQRQQQKEDVLKCLMAARQDFADLPSSSSHAEEAESPTTIQAQNATQLRASLALLTAYRATEDAGARLQQCLQEEQILLECLEIPLQQSLGQSVQLIQFTADALQQEDPHRELRHTEMLLR